MGNLTFSNQKLQGNFNYTDGEYSAQGMFSRNVDNNALNEVNAHSITKGEKLIGNAYITYSDGQPNLSLSVLDYSEMIALTTIVGGLVAAFAADDTADA